MNNRVRRNRNSPGEIKQVSNFCFYLYLLYTCSFFLHFTARIPVLGVVRPDLIMVIILMFSLFSQQEKLKGKASDSCARSLNLFLFYFVLSLPFVEWPGSVIADNIQTFVKALVFFYFTIFIIDSRKRMKQMVFVFVTCQVVRVLEPLFLNITTGYTGSDTFIGDGQFVGRLAGAPSDVVNPNGLALVIVSTFTYLHFLLGSSTGKWKMTYFSLIPPLLYALILTLSRSGFIALLVVVWQVFMRSRSKVVLIFILMVGASGAWLNMSDIQRARYLSLGGSDNSAPEAFKGSARGRIDAWFSELDTFLYRPIVGHGVGTSAEASFHTRGSAVLSHNLYTELLVEVGAIGFILYMLFIKSIYQSLRKNIQLIESRELETPELDETLVFYRNLARTFIALFWMYVIFSFAQYGLREYNWYFLAGMTCMLSLQIKQHIESITPGSTPAPEKAGIAR